MTNALEHPGRCVICQADVVFTSRYKWYRDHLKCPRCDSVPRERALMYVLETFYPQWRKLRIHEMAPTGRGVSLKLREAAGYEASQYFPSLPLGERSPEGWMNQDAENLTYADDTFDLVVTQDVFEHVFDIDAAFLEIRRTLRPGGAHIFTTPLVNKARSTECRASRAADGSIRHHAEPEHHDNPVSPDGALVTWHFGFDLAARVTERVQMPTVIFSYDRLDLGIRAEYIEVLMSLKSAGGGG